MTSSRNEVNLILWALHKVSTKYKRQPQGATEPGKVQYFCQGRNPLLSPKKECSNTFSLKIILVYD
jgi:hypothetical protein